MMSWQSIRVMGLALVVAVGCEQSKVAPAPSASPGPSAAPSSGTTPPEAKADASPPQPCGVTGTVPVELGTINGELFGWSADTTHLYYSSWQLYGSRGDVVAVRKDGGGQNALVSLKYEPRALVVDDKYIYYTAGILLQRTPKDGSTTDTINAQFSAKGLALLGEEIYGVPGDYGPYDRIARIGRRGGDITELVTSPRPKVDGPKGFVAMAVDASGVYVADAGGKRVAKLAAGSKKLATLAKSGEPVVDLALDDTQVLFVTEKGSLLQVKKTGGTAKKLAGPVTEAPRVALVAQAAYTVLAGASPEAPSTVSRVALDTGETSLLAPIPPDESVTGIYADDRCVYWVSRKSATKSRILALPR